MAVSKSKLLTSGGVILALIFTGAVLGKQQYTQWQQRKAINTEINQLKNQEATYNKENQQLSNSLSFLSTTDYKEQIAREQLNLKKDGEMVVNFPVSLGQNPDTQNGNSKPASNFEKWWTYLFKHK